MYIIYIHCYFVNNNLTCLRTIYISRTKTSKDKIFGIFIPNQQRLQIISRISFLFLIFFIVFFACSRQCWLFISYQLSYNIREMWIPRTKGTWLDSNKETFTYMMATLDALKYVMYLVRRRH